jgi:glycosyltransferase involved in cell wall biosynthesis
MNRLLFKRKTILAPRGMLGKGALQGKRAKKNLFFLAARAIGIYQGVCWHASTPLEAKEVMEVFPRAKIHVAKNIPLQSEHRHAERTFESIKLLYVGRISKKKNLSFVIDVLAAMNLKMKVQLRIVGPIEDPDYAEMIMNAIPEESKLEVTMEGSLNHEDVAESFRASHFMVLPTLHENYGHAIVESWAHGCPVVLSTNTPWRDLNSKGIGWDLPLDKTAWKGVFQEIEAMNEADWNRLSDQCMRYFQSSVYSAEDERANLALFDL